MKNIPPILLYEYVEVIEKMQKYRWSPSLYGDLDKQRSKIHHKILDYASTTKSSNEFACDLAYWVEECLKARSEIEKYQNERNPL
jgi:hypothetical protein